MEGFPHRDVRPATRTSSRVTAAGLMLCVYGLLAFLALLPSAPPPEPAPREIFALLLPDRPHEKNTRPPAPFLAHLIRPHVENISPPDFTVAAANPPTPAPLPASATPASPLAGGVPGGEYGSAGSANGTSGTGNAVSGCFDAVWAQAVTDRIARFFRWPRFAPHATGLVMVDFTVRRSGRLDALKIGTSSGNSDLDWAAYDMVRRAQPLPAIPDRMHMAWIEVELPVNFGMSDADLHPSPGTCG